MKKLLKLIPFTLLSVLALTGCADKPTTSSSSSDSTSGNGDDEPTTSKLAEFVEALPEGELTEEQVQDVMDVELLNSGERMTKQAAIKEHSTFYNYNYEGASFTEEEKHMIINDDLNYQQIQLYENDIIKVANQRVLFPYDEASADPDAPNHQSGHKEEPIFNEGYGTIGKLNEDDDHLTYLYYSTADEKESFKLDLDSSYTIKNLSSGLSIGEDILGGIDQTLQWWDAQKGKDSKVEPVKKFEKNKDGELIISFRGEEMDHKYASLERAFGYEENEKGQTIKDKDGNRIKATDCFDDLFYDVGLSIGYEIKIKGNIVTYANFDMLSLTGQVYKFNHPEDLGKEYVFKPYFVNNKGDLNTYELQDSPVAPHPEFEEMLEEYNEPIHVSGIKHKDGTPFEEFDLDLNGPITTEKPSIYMAPYLNYEFGLSESYPEDEWDMNKMPKVEEGDLSIYNDQDGLYVGAWFDDQELMEPYSGEDDEEPVEEDTATEEA